jgi:hypothetical protein
MIWDKYLLLKIFKNVGRCKWLTEIRTASKKVNWAVEQTFIHFMPKVKYCYEVNSSKPEFFKKESGVLQHPYVENREFVFESSVKFIGNDPNSYKLQKELEVLCSLTLFEIKYTPIKLWLYLNCYKNPDHAKRCYVWDKSVMIPEGYLNSSWSKPNKGQITVNLYYVLGGIYDDKNVWSVRSTFNVFQNKIYIKIYNSYDFRTNRNFYLNISSKSENNVARSRHPSSKTNLGLTPVFVRSLNLT